MSTDARDLISGMLVMSKKRRLGNRKGAKEVKSMPFFQGFDFPALLRRELRVPIHVDVYGDNDTRMFSKPPEHPADQNIFRIPTAQEELFLGF